jgi:predicted acyltransferase
LGYTLPVALKATILKGPLQALLTALVARWGPVGGWVWTGSYILGWWFVFYWLYRWGWVFRL